MKYRRHTDNIMFRKWNHMMQRCYNPKNKSYQDYGGRGITVSNRWHNFENFVDDMLPSYVRGLSLDRTNNDIGYTFENCRWATQKQQCNNRRSNHLLLDPASNEWVTVSQFARIYNIARPTIHSRLARGYTKFEDLTRTSLKRRSASGRFEYDPWQKIKRAVFD